MKSGSSEDHGAAIFFRRVDGRQGVADERDEAAASGAGAVACEPPADRERPISHWSLRELAEEVIKRGIVDSISPRQVDRFLAKQL